MITREYGEIAGAGGVKDVVAQLSRALARWNSRKVSIVLPYYGFIDGEALGAEAVADPEGNDSVLRFRVDMKLCCRGPD